MGQVRGRKIFKKGSPVLLCTGAVDIQDPRSKLEFWSCFRTVDINVCAQARRFSTICKKKKIKGFVSLQKNRIFVREVCRFRAEGVKFASRFDTCLSETRGIHPFLTPSCRTPRAGTTFLQLQLQKLTIRSRSAQTLAR